MPKTSNKKKLLSLGLAAVMMFSAFVGVAGISKANAATKKPCSHITTVITDANAGLKVVATKSPNTSGAYIQKYNQATKKWVYMKDFWGHNIPLTKSRNSVSFDSRDGFKPSTTYKFRLIPSKEDAKKYGPSNVYTVKTSSAVTKIKSVTTSYNSKTKKVTFKVDGTKWTGFDYTVKKYNTKTKKWSKYTSGTINLKKPVNPKSVTVSKKLSAGKYVVNVVPSYTMFGAKWDMGSYFTSGSKTSAAFTVK